MARTLPLRQSFALLGRIRIGASDKRERNGKTVKVPRRLDSFRLTSQDKAVIDKAAQLYGGDVQAWPDAPQGIPQWQVITTANAMRVIVQGTASMRAFYEVWDGETCSQRCDGCYILKDVAHPERVGGECTCEDGQESASKLVTRLDCTLPDVAPYGLWRLASHGINATADMLGTARLLEAQGQAPTQPFEALLRLDQRRSGGRLIRVPVLHPLMGQSVPAPRLATPLQADDAARDLFGDHVQTLAPALPTEPNAEERVDIDDLIETIEALLRDGGLDPARYWSRLCDHWAIERPQHLTSGQLQNVLGKLRSDLAQRASQVTAVEDVSAEGDHVPF
jgi:hypothetical protein